MKAKIATNFRLATKKSDFGSEWIEQSANGCLWWKARDSDMECGFPIELETAEAFFVSIGRVLEKGKLPVPPLENPYNSWV